MDQSLKKLEEKILKGKGLFASIEQRKTCEFFSTKGYRTFGGTEQNEILMSYIHSTGDRTKIVVYPGGGWDKINPPRPRVTEWDKVVAKIVPDISWGQIGGEKLPGSMVIVLG